MAAHTAESYSREELRRILRLSERQLAAWQRQGLVAPGPYNFSDLIAVKTIQKLRQNNVPLKKIQRGVASLRRKLQDIERPLTELKISSDGRRIVVSYRGADMEPDTGQLLFNFETRRLQASVRALQTSASPSSSIERKQEAEGWFLSGLKLEERGETTPEAIQAYVKAIELNPEAAGAYINLGTIYYNLRRLDDAEKCYRAAIAIDPDYALAYFNLGNVFDERGNAEEARKLYETALQLAPGYADAHYNLALSYERLGVRGKAAQHWRAYLKLDPSSPWANYAQQQLSRGPFRIVSPDPDKPRSN
jgi:tetratricopeptide (TPR) repeat protein